MNNPTAENSGSPRLPSPGGLTRKTFGSFLWMFAGAGAEAVIRIFVLIILARLLTPEAFGVVAAALTIVALAEIFGRIGIAPSIVQIETLRPEHVRTAFTFTTLMGCVVGAACYFGAGAIAALYAMPELTSFVQVVSLLFIIRSLMIVSEALLMRHMRFRTLAIASFVSYAVGYAAVSVGLALMGWGGWALIWGQIVQATLLTTILMLAARHSFLPSLDWPSIKHMGRFGSGVTLTQIANYLAMNGDYFVVGRFLGAEALGFYSRAYVLLNQLNGLVGKMGDRVLFPAVAAVQNDPERVSRSFHRAVSLSMLTQMPLALVLVVAAPEVIDVLLGDQWVSVILPFQILIAALAVRASYKFVGTIMRAKGAVFLNAYWQGIYAVLVLTCAFVGTRYGILGVAVGVSFAMMATFALGVFFLRRLMPLHIGEIVSSAIRSAVFCAILAAVLIPLRLYLLDDGYASLLVLVVLCVVYGAIFGLTMLLVPQVFGSHGRWLGETIKGFLVLRMRRPAIDAST